MSSDAPSSDSNPDFQVRLKPLFGIAPKYYLAGIYGIVLLGVLLMVLLIPGVTRPGALVTVNSTPPGALVVWNDRPYGATPLRVFMAQGKGALVVSKPGFVASTQDFSVDNQPLLAWAFPARQSVNVTLKVQDSQALGVRALLDWGKWAQTAPFTSDYRFPPVFGRFASDAQAAGWDVVAIKDWLLKGRSLVADPQMYQDFGRALGLWKDLPPDGLKAQWELWKPLVTTDQARLVLWILANQTKPIRDRENSEISDWLKAQVDAFQGTLLSLKTPIRGTAPGAITTSIGSFRGVGSAEFLACTSTEAFGMPVELPYVLPVPVKVPSFWIAEQEVTESQFAGFIEAHPEWGPTARDRLVQSGQVDADYLQGWTSLASRQPNAPVSSVSWYAAEAFVRWLNSTGKAPAGHRFALPTEAQWEAAARSPGGATMVNSGVWEWTATEWGPGDLLTGDATAVSAEVAYARTLKGGSGQVKSNVQPWDRAGWPASGTTPGLGFRLALVGAP